MLILLAVLLSQDAAQDDALAEPYSPPARENAADGGDDGVLLRQQFVDGEVWEQTLQFELRPPTGKTADDDGIAPSLMRYELAARIRTDAVGSDGSARCSYQAGRLTGRVDLGADDKPAEAPAADESDAPPLRVPPLSFDSERTASARSEMELIEAEVFRPWRRLSEMIFAFEAQPTGEVALSGDAAGTGSPYELRSRAEDADEAMRAALLELLSWKLPPKAVAVGASWTEDRGDRTVRYTLAGPARGGYRITVAAEGKPIGELVFDTEQRRLVSARLSRTLPDGSQSLSKWTLKKTDAF